MEIKDKKQQVTAYCRQFKTPGINANIDQIITEAESRGSGFWDYTLRLLAAEARHRHHNEVITAVIPTICCHDKPDGEWV